MRRTRPIERCFSRLRGLYDRLFSVREFQILNRGTVILKNHYVDDFLGNLFWPRKPKQIGLHGGLGDVLLLLPFIRLYRMKYPRRKIQVIYTDVRTDRIDPKTYGLGATRLEQGPEGTVVNPTADILENVPFIDEKKGGDPTQADDYWIPDSVFRRRWGKYLTPSEYSELLFPDIFEEGDVKSASAFFEAHGLRDKFVIAFHFRRAADKIAELYDIINSDVDSRGHVKCLCLGSSRNQIVPAIDMSHAIDLTDNYAKGIPLRTLYQILMKCRLFIGGRGSLEHFCWLARVPSINFMDEHALGQDQNAFGTWIPEFWMQNRFTEVIHAETAVPLDVYERLIRPFYCEWRRLARKDSRAETVTVHECHPIGGV